MKKKILGILFCGVLILGITGCRDKQINNRVSLIVKEGTLTNKGVTLILKNYSKNNYSYGNPYYIEKENDGEWSIVTPIHEMNFTLPAYGLEAGKEEEFNIDFEYGYGRLEIGKYRIVKEIFKSSSTNIDNSIKFNVYAEFEIDEDDFEYKKAVEEDILLKTEVEAMNHGNNSEDLTKYRVYVKNNKLYAKNLNTNEEKIVFDKELVKNIAIRPICCTGNSLLLILTVDGNVYISEKDCIYAFSFDFPFKKLDVSDIVAFKLIPVNENDVVKNLYGVDSKGNEILLHKIN